MPRPNDRATVGREPVRPFGHHGYVGSRTVAESKAHGPEIPVAARSFPVPEWPWEKSQDRDRTWCPMATVIMITRDPVMGADIEGACGRNRIGRRLLNSHRANLGRIKGLQVTSLQRNARYTIAIRTPRSGFVIWVVSVSALMALRGGMCAVAHPDPVMHPNVDIAAA